MTTTKEHIAVYARDPLVWAAALSCLGLVVFLGLFSLIALELVPVTWALVVWMIGAYVAGILGASVLVSRLWRIDTAWRSHRQSCSVCVAYRAHQELHKERVFGR